ncbi:MAG: Nif3-like dinuclear metal center hexameric protein [Bacteroidia bacterium]
MQLHQITSFLESKAHLSLQESYDNSGLIVGDKNAEITKAIISLDCTEAVVDEAIAKGANLIISHHPIVFKGLKSFTGKNYVERVVMKAIKNDIALYAIHTNLDNVQHGVNKKIADLLGLENTQILAPMSGRLQKLVTFVPKANLDEVSQAMFSAGAGNIGNYDQCSFSTEGLGSFRAGEGADPFIGVQGKIHREEEFRLEVIVNDFNSSQVIKALFNAHPYEEVAYFLQDIKNTNQEIGAGMVGGLSKEMSFEDFIQHLKRSMQLKIIRATKAVNRPIKKVALCGGSGSFLLNKAKAKGADVFITGDFKYHEFFDAENEISILDIGHYESERFTIDLIHEWLREKFSTFALLKTDVNTNPVNYL